MKYLSILGWIAGGIVLIYSVIPGEYTPGVIRIACDDPRMPAIASHLSGLLQGEGIALSVVPLNAPAEVSIEFVADMGIAQGGTAFGYIRIRDDTPMNVLYLVTLHEILHDAGVSHEPNDLTSIMHTHAKTHGQLKPAHVEALRKLPGITPIGRVANYIAARWGR